MNIQKLPEKSVFKRDIEHQADEHKIRPCLVCSSPFPSAWAGERICRGCKSKKAWRSAVTPPRYR